MKKITVIVLMLFTVLSYAQVGINIAIPHTSSALDVTSTSAGFLPPRMTAVQRAAITSPALGLLVFCTDCASGDGELQVNYVSGWKNAAGGSISDPTVTGNYYSSGALVSNAAISEWFDRSLDVYGIRLLVAGAAGGQLAVPDEWAKKTAQVYKLLMDKNAAGIDPVAQEKMIKILLGEEGWHQGYPAGQRIGYGGGNTYTPSPLTDEGRSSYDGLEALFDTMALDDMVWYQNVDSQGTGNDDIAELLEHVLHTLHRFGTRGAVDGSLEGLNMESEEEDITNTELYLAMVEAHTNNVYGIDGYGGDITNSDMWPVMIKEYQYLLTFGMWSYGSEFWENGTLSPEWNDNARTPEGVLQGNPLGYALFNKYMAPVLSRPDVSTLRTMFQDNDGGVSGYVPD